MKLFVNGCSFSYGGSIFPLYDENNQLINFHSRSIINQERLSNIWSNHLGRYLGSTEIINYSLCNNSNEAILRTSLDYLNSQTEYDDLTVLIQWSNPDRFEFYDEVNHGWIQVSGSNSWIFVPDDLSFNFSLQDEHFVKHIQEKLNMFYKHFYSEYQAALKSLNYFELLGEYLKNKKINYVFCLLTYGLFDKMKKTDNYFKNKIDHISKSYNWLHGDMSYSTLKPLIPENMLTTTMHPDLKGHEQIAIKLRDYIINKIQ